MFALTSLSRICAIAIIFLQAAMPVVAQGNGQKAKDNCPNVTADDPRDSRLVEDVGGGHTGPTVDVTSGDPMGGDFQPHHHGKSRLFVNWGDEFQPTVTWTVTDLPTPPVEPVFGIDSDEDKDDVQEPLDHEDSGDTNAPCEGNETPCPCGACSCLTTSIMPPSVGIPIALMRFVPPSSTGSNHSAVSVPDGSGMFMYRQHTGGPNGQIQPNQEIRYVDGTINFYEVYNVHGSTRRHWRITRSVDPYDNLTSYRYAGGKLEKVEHPDGIDECYSYQPSWIGLAAGGWPGVGEGTGVQYSGIEVTYKDRATSTVIDGRTRCYLYKKRATIPHGTVTGSTSPLNGDLLYRVYEEKGRYLDGLANPQSNTLYSIPGSLDVTNQHQVVEYDYVVGSALIKSIGYLLSTSIIAGSETAAKPAVTYSYASVGNRARVQTETLHVQALTFTYAYDLHATQVDKHGQSAITKTTRTSPDSQDVVYEMDDQGRITSVKTTPKTGSGVEDRAADADYDAAHDDQPTYLETKYEYGSGWCTCRGRPTAVVQLPSNRRTEYDYEPLTGLLEEIRELNPSGAAAPAVTKFEWLPENPLNPHGRWRLHKHTNAEGEIREWTYYSLSGNGYRQNPAWGKKDELVVLTHPEVTLSTGGTPQTYSDVTFYNVTHPVLLDVSIPALPSDQRQLVGQVTEIVGADGVSTTFSYDNFGRLAGSVTNPGGGNDEITATYSFDRWGNLDSTTQNASSANPLTTTVERDGRGAPRWIASTVNGVPHVQRFYYDEWGNTAVVLSTNKTSTGGTPDDFRPGQQRSDTARDWLREEWHYQGGRLRTGFVDRRALDRDEAGAVADAGDARFARTDYTWSPDGWLLQVVNPNGAETNLVYDGFGSLFKATTVGGGSSVLMTKYFVNNALEVSRQVDGLGNATIIERNTAGIVSKVTEPSTPNLPTGYLWSAAPASTSFVTDVMGRTVEVAVDDVVTSARIVRRKTLFDEIGRVYEVQQFKAAEANPDRVTQAIWDGAGTIAKITYPSGRYIERDYDSLKRLKEVRDGLADPTKVLYSYLANSPFAEKVERWNWDEGATTPGYVKRPVVYVRDNLGRALEQQIMPSVPLPPGSTVSTPLVHTFHYYTNGSTESYTDPSGKIERYLPDAVGRLRERFLAGANPIWNGTEHQDWTGVADRSKVLLTDGLGQTTTSIYDFAGRPVVVMEPGATVEPTVANPHQAYARLMAYDAASRLSTVYGSEDIEIAYRRDATGQLLQRDRVVDSSTINNSVVSWLWDRDNLRYDALGQLVETSSYTLLDDEYIHEEFERDVFHRTLKESYSYVSNVGGPDVLSTFSPGESFRATVAIDNHDGSDDLGVQYTPDRAGRVASIDWRVDTDPWKSLAAYKHEGGAIRARTTTQELGIAGGTTAFEFDTTYLYDAYGRMEQIDQSFDASAFVKFEYDLASNLTKEIYNKQGVGQKGDRFEYDEHHRLYKAWLGSDQAHLATNDGDDPTGTFVKKLTYNLDAANNRSSVKDKAGPSGGETTTAYSKQAGNNRYDTVAGITLAYDERGNLTFDGNFYYIFDALNRLTEVYVLESDSQQQASSGAPTSTTTSSTKYAVSDMSALRLARSNIMQRLSTEQDIVDRANDSSLRVARTEPLSASAVSAVGPAGASAPEPVQLVQKSWYLYDAMNRRVTRWVGDDGTYFYAWDGWQQVQELTFRNQGGVFSAELKQFVWGEQLDELVAYRRSVGIGANWENFYIAEGGAHCPTRVLNEAGVVVETQEYDPYGKTTFYDLNGVPRSVSQVGNSYGWKCVAVDHETGLAYMRHRYFDPAIGRFASRDPLGVGGDPMTWFNAYNYGSASPMIQSDAFGLQIFVVSSFVPYQGGTTNASQVSAADLGAALKGAGKTVEDALLSVEWDTTQKEVKEKISQVKKNNPGEEVVWIAFGEGGGRVLETTGRNDRSAKNALDNKLNPAKDDKNDPKGPKTVKPRVNAAKVATLLGVTTSDDADGYLCNSVAYELYRAISQGDLGYALFFHVPAKERKKARDEFTAKLVENLLGDAGDADGDGKSNAADLDRFDDRNLTEKMINAITRYK